MGGITAGEVQQGRQFSDPVNGGGKRYIRSISELNGRSRQGDSQRSGWI